jgi:hypothetical protein
MANSGPNTNGVFFVATHVNWTNDLLKWHPRFSVLHYAISYTLPRHKAHHFWPRQFRNEGGTASRSCRRGCTGSVSSIALVLAAKTIHNDVFLDRPKEDIKIHKARVLWFEPRNGSRIVLLFNASTLCACCFSFSFSFKLGDVIAGISFLIVRPFRHRRYVYVSSLILANM